MDFAIEFADQWNNKMDDSVDTVYIFTHGTERILQFEDGSKYNALTIDGKIEWETKMWQETCMT